MLGLAPPRKYSQQASLAPSGALQHAAFHVPELPLMLEVEDLQRLPVTVWMGLCIFN